MQSRTVTVQSLLCLRAMWTVCGAGMSLRDAMWKIWRIQHLEYLSL